MARKTYVLGKTDYNGSGRRNCECAIEWELRDGRFAMSACVWNPRKTDIYMGGQCVDEVASLFPEDLKAQRMVSVWNLWHLNDMRAGCAHQVGPDWDASARVEVVTYKLTGEARNLMKATLRRAQECAINGVAFEMCPQERALVGLRESWLKDVHTPPDADSPLSGCYEVAKREEKGVGWVHPHEHPRGILCKPCPVCGYKYGTAWKLEPLPDDVVAFLSSLPESTIVPAWV